MFSLPDSVSIREVAPRDGLQIEAPVALPAKLDLLDAIAHTGVRRVEATSFVSPRAVPSLADAEQVAAALGRWPDIQFSALIASATGARRALAAGVTDLEYVISASDAHSRANVGRSTHQSVDLIEPLAELLHAAGGHLEVIIATAWDCPFTGATPISAVAEIARVAATRGADRLCLGDTIGTTTPAAYPSC